MLTAVEPISAWARYQWTSGVGGWAEARSRWASRPGKRFTHHVLTSADDRLLLAYQGFPEGMTYILPYLRDQMAGEIGTVAGADEQLPTWRQMLRAAHRPEADILVLGCTRERARRLPPAMSVLLPFRINMTLDIDADAVYSSVSANERRQFAALRRRHQWTCEIGTKVEDLKFFYERMHLPTMASRHGEEARSTDWNIARHALLRHGLVLFVREGDKRVAGVLARLEDGGRTLWMRLLGVLDGASVHYRSGAVKAVYYLTMEWAAEHGVTRVNFSGGDPFPGKGVFQFKRRLHPTITHPTDHFGKRRVYLRVARDSPAVRDFLAATPMLTVDDSDRIVATYFFDCARPIRSDIRADGPGVRGARAIDLDEFLTGSSGRKRT
ncbi:GNAT family N-acetyltransferase [Streptomyces avidinii]|uniref:GNAT family N-acetyltransferase n=1 Tax=Streptomyces avidinii TaxID=1895 RepID=UPI00386849B2|nr:GNAT family N-acetyltransferase [Streptomyces avidinii]